MSTFFFLLHQALRGPLTHPFPFIHMPDHLREALWAVKEGRADVCGPLPIPDGLWGQLVYDRQKCRGCRACLSRCCAEAISESDEKGKIEIDLACCCLCGACVDACRHSALSMGDSFLNATADRTELLLTDSGSVQMTDEADLWSEEKGR